MAEPLLQIRDLHVAYGANEVVRGISLDLAAGEIVAIVGESGSGKSTVAKALMGLATVRAGSIVNRSHGLQMIFQDAVGSLNPRMTIRATLEETRAVTRRRLGRVVDPPEALLAEVGLSEAILDQYPREMSGGQCQRVSIARALACQPEILVADEPVSALDVSVQARVLNLLRDLRRTRNLAILLIAHDLAVVRNVCDRLHVMEKGVFVESGPADSVFSHPSSPVTQRLLACVPRLAVPTPSEKTS